MDNAVQEVLAAEQAWLKAHLELDLEAIEQLMAQDYVQIGDSGQVIRRARAISSLASGTRHWDSVHIDQLQVRVYGDTAVVVGRWVAKGQNAGKPFDYSSRYASVWVKSEERWRMVLDQATPITAEVR